MIEKEKLLIANSFPDKLLKNNGIIWTFSQCNITNYPYFSEGTKGTLEFDHVEHGVWETSVDIAL